MAGDLTPYICNMAGVLLKARLLTIREHLSFHLRCFGGVRVAHVFSCFVLSYYMSLRSEFRVVMSSDIHIEAMFGSSLTPVVCGRTHVLFTLFVFDCAW